MKKSIKLILAVFSVVFFSCDDVLEEDISDEKITIIAPTEGSIFEGNTVQFNWEEIEDADEYNIQIRNENNILVLDSAVVSNIFNYELESEAYQWQVRGQNFAYETDYSPLINFSVIPFSDLEEQEVNLQTPVDLLATNSITDFRFSWDAIETASSYDFEILELETDKIVYTNQLSVSEFTIDTEVLTEDNAYKWQVRAVNNSSQSDFYFRTLYFDTQVPPMATLLTPSSTDTLTNNEAITITWEYSDLGNMQTEITSVVEIASDDNFANILLTESDNTANTFSYTPTSTGSYYWRVIGTDAASNEGEYSDTGVFTVN